MAKKTITSTLELTPEQLTDIIKSYFKNKHQKDVTNVRYTVGDTSDDRFGGPFYNLMKIEVINEISEDVII